MGTQTLGSTSAPPNNNAFVYWTFSGGDIIKGTNGHSAATDMYVDTIVVYCGSESGSQSFKFALYTAGGTLLGATGNAGPFGVGYAWNGGSFPAGSYLHVPSGTSVVGAAYAPNNIQTAGLQDGGNFAYHTGSGFPSPWSGSTQGGLGNLAWYLTYFPPASITGIPSGAVTPGSSFTVSGQSFSAGVTAVSVGGVACPSWTVVNDTTLSVTAPSQGVTGQVVVTTNAGTATSSGSMTVGQIYDGTGGGVGNPIAIWGNPNGAGVAKVVAVYFGQSNGTPKRIW